MDTDIGNDNVDTDNGKGDNGKHDIKVHYMKWENAHVQATRYEIDYANLLGVVCLFNLILILQLATLDLFSTRGARMLASAFYATPRAFRLSLKVVG